MQLLKHRRIIPNRKVALKVAQRLKLDREVLVVLTSGTTTGLSLLTKKCDFAVVSRGELPSGAFVS